jgi:REP element-mobilizing transposase RayT
LSTHSYSRCWIHMTWATRRREPILPRPAAVEVSGFLADYAKGKGIYMVINYVNPEHTHALIDLQQPIPSRMSRSSLREHHLIG